MNDTLIKILQQAKTGITFVKGRDAEEYLSYKELWDKSAKVLGRLQDFGLEKNDELIFQIRDNQHFLIVFWACILGGIVPVPVSLGIHRDHQLKVFKIWKALKRPFLIAEETHYKKLLAFPGEDLLKSQISDHFVPLPEAMSGTRIGKIEVSDPSDLAYIQFSSGSTGTPKGVKLTHENLIFNLSDILRRSETTDKDSILSWMPLTHDMGLICFHLCGVMAGIDQYILPTQLFLSDPLIWLSKSSEHKITQLYSPNFGLYYLLKAVEESGFDGDLSPIRIIYNGAETISHAICERFSRTLKPFGLHSNTMFPGYGLAEASVAVALPKVGQPLHVYNLKRQHLNTGDKVEETTPEDPNGVHFIQTGFPIDNCAVRICDKSDNVLNPKTIGGIQIKGKNVTNGYYGAEEEWAKVVTDDGWVRTGDLGFIDELGVTITGREKNMIVVNGQNYYPQDIERVILSIFSEFSVGQVVACSHRNKSGVEEILIFVNFKKRGKEFVRYVRRIKQATFEQIGIEVHEVIPARKIPKTTSGKIQYFQLKRDYEEGAYDKVLSEIQENLDTQLVGALNVDLSLHEKLLQIWNNLPISFPISGQDDLIEGGLNSIMANSFIGRVRRTLKLKVHIKDIFVHRSINNLATFLEGSSGKEIEPIQYIEEQDYYSASSAQRRFWLWHELHPNPDAFVIHLANWFEGSLDVDIVNKTFQSIIDEHEILRTTFLVVNGELMQRVLTSTDFNFVIDYLDLSQERLTEHEANSRAREISRSDFDLFNGPLFKVTVAKIGNKKHLFLFDIHHIISDGWSINEIGQRFRGVYTALKNGADKPTQDRKIQFRDVDSWKKKRSTEKEWTFHQDYWLKDLNVDFEPLILPFAKNIHINGEINGELQRLYIDEKTTKGLHLLSQKNGATLFMTLLSTLKLLFYRYLGQTEIVIGTASADRTHPELDNQLGYYLNTLPISTRLDGQDGFLDLLEKVKVKTLGAFEYQEYPFENMIQDLGLPIDSGTPVFNVLMVLQNFNQPLAFDADFDEVKVKSVDLKLASTLMDIEFEFIESDKGLRLDLRYNQNLYATGDIRRFLDHLDLIIKEAIKEPTFKLGAIQLLLPQDKLLLDRTNQTAQSYPEVTVVTLFENTVDLSPHSIAVTYLDESISYTKLNETVNKLSHCLISEYAVSAGVPVGILMHDSKNCLLSILAILKTGGTYVPIDPLYPQERIDYIVKDCALSLILSDGEDLDAQVGNHVTVVKISDLNTAIASNHNPKVNLDFGGPAYILYTSGTTGRPKGILISHESLSDYVHSFAEYFTLTNQDKVIQQSTISFDTSIEEIFPVFKVGGQLLLTKENGRSIAELKTVISTNSATILSTTPLVIMELNKEVEQLSNLRILISGGDVLRPEYISNWIDNVELYNTYGPTESTVCIAYHRIEELEDAAILGTPTRNHEILILDEHQSEVPMGGRGEICVSGKGLAIGYINAPDQTKASFVEIDGKRVYKTGDLGTWLPNGGIKLQGRKDHQVKLRGYRIEPGEVEKSILKYPNVSDTHVAITLQNKVPHLVAFVIGENVEFRLIREFLEGILPIYMVPSFFSKVEAIPRTLTGKIDSRKLVEQFAPEKNVSNTSIAPSSETEHKLVRIWSDVLAKEITVLDNFFEAGGNSLTAMQIIARVEEQFKVRMSIKDLFMNTTVQNLGVFLDNAANSQGIEMIKVQGDGSKFELSFGQRRIWVLNQIESARAAYNLTWTFKLTGSGVEIACVSALEKLVERHESLRTIFPLAGEEVFQQVLDYKPGLFHLLQRDAQATPVNWQEIAQEYATTPFDLGKGPLFRVALIHVHEHEFQAIFTFHHIICDGWSLEVFVTELMALMDAEIKSVRKPLAPLKFQYKDYSKWYANQLELPHLKSSGSYWVEKFSGEIPKLDLPISNRRPATMTYNGNTISSDLSGILPSIEGLSGKQGATPFMVILALFKVLFYRYTGQSDIVIGTPVAGRTHVELEGQIGYFLNMLPLRTNFNVDGTFLDILESVKTTVTDAFEHGEYPIDKLIDQLSLKRDTSRTPLFDVILVFQNFQKDYNAFNHSESEFAVEKIQDFDNGTSLNDLLIELNSFNGQWTMKVRYNTHLFAEAQIKQMILHFKILTEAVLSNTKRRLHQYDFLDDSESENLLNRFQPKVQVPQPFEAVTELIAKQMKCSAHRLALNMEDQAMTYSMLEKRANTLTGFIKNSLAVNPGELIGILLGRSDKMIISMLAIWRAGCAYVPMDISYPKDRIDLILEDCGIQFLITDSDEYADSNHLTIVDAFPQINTQTDGELEKNYLIEPESPAYVMYTSGTTGRPKGVVVSHGAVADYVKTFVSTFDINGSDRVVHQSALTFDTSIEEIFPVLTQGGSVVISKEGGSNIDKMLDLISFKNPTVLSVTPMVLHELNLSGKELPSLRLLISGGDILRSENVTNLIQKCEIYNTYGPTETTVCVTFQKVTELKDVEYIGQPIPNHKIHILDEHMNLVPVGVTGSIYVEGIGLAQGYLNNPEETNRKFISCQVSNTKLYATGDIGHWTEEGRIKFLGRVDDQVKIRGHRVELAEIEEVLTSHIKVQQAAVLSTKRDSNSWQLIAFICAPDLSADAARDWLMSKLPVYMVPDHIMVLDELPKLVSNKIDKKALLQGYNQKEIVIALPNKVFNEIEKVVSGIWTELLDKEITHIEENFFDLGGNSINAVRIANRLSEHFEIPLTLLDVFGFPTVRSFGLKINSLKGSNTVQKIFGAEEQEYYELSNSQKRIWFLSHLEEENPAYNIVAAYRLKGSIHIENLEKSILDVVSQNAALRTRFIELENVPFQKLIELEQFDFRLRKVDLLNAQDQEEQLHLICTSEQSYKFDLSGESLFRATLIKLSEEDYVILFSMHHIVSDGWSLAIILSEMTKTYQGLSQGIYQPGNFIPEKYQFSDYIRQQKELVNTQEFDIHRNYWLDQFKNDIPGLNLPTDHKRPSFRTTNGGVESVLINKQISDDLIALGQNENATVFMVLLAALNVLLFRLSGQKDIVVGTAVAGRDNVHLEDIVGFFVNTIPLRARFEAEDQFEELVNNISDIVRTGFAHQAFPFGHLVEALNAERDPGRSPIFDVMMVMQNAVIGKEEKLTLDTLAVDPYPLQQNFSQFDLAFNVYENSSGLLIDVQYNTDLFEADRVRRMLDYYVNILKGVSTNKNVAICDIEILTPDEKRQLLEPTGLVINKAPASSVIDLIAEQASKTPDAIALVNESKTLTYADVWRQSGKLATQLIGSLDVQPGDLVGLMLDRSEQMVIAMLAILKSGACYVPIDPAYPENRIQFILDDSQVKKIVVQRKYAKSFDSHVSCLFVEDGYDDCKVDDAVIDVSARDAYVIYTSGSTGQPKGVVITHANLASFLQWSAREFREDDFKIVYANTSYCFDLSIFEIFYPLTIGKTIRILQSGTDISEALKIDNHVLVNTVPSLIETLVKTGTDFSKVSAINMAGEPIPTYLKEKLKSSKARIRNLYGPSEDTTYSTCYQFRDDDEMIPIGTPVDNTRIYITDAYLNLLPQGAVGEICISGDGIAKGYLNNPELTESVFINNPFHSGMRLYRTGDQGRLNSDGQLEFLGRKDNQVKIRGFRVELEEIEAILANCPGVERVLVTSIEDSIMSKALVLYYVAQELASEEHIRDYLSEKLPEYMMPTHFIRLSTFPLTPNGKVDRVALPDVDHESIRHLKNSPNELLSETETKIRDIWVDVLQNPYVGKRDSFFKIGGHSLKAIQIISRINQVFDTDLSLKDIFQYPEIEKLGRVINKSSQKSVENIPTIEEQDHYRASDAQRRLWIIDKIQTERTIYNMTGGYHIQGILDITLLEKAYTELIRRHEILRTVLVEIDNEPRQKILSNFEVQLDVVKLKSGRTIEEMSQELLIELASTSFQLDQYPLFKLKLLKCASDDFRLLISMHHIISDGWSMTVFVKEICALYAYYQGQQETKQLPALDIQYKDYTQWQNERATSDILAKQKSYWLNKLNDELPVLDVANDKTRPLRKTYTGENLTTYLNSDLCDKLRETASDHNSSLLMLLLAILKVLFYKYSGQKDIIVGTPVAGREHLSLEDQIGFYVNTLAIRTSVDSNQTILELLELVKRNMLDAQLNQDYPFDRLVDELGLKRNLSRSPIFDIMVMFESMDLDSERYAPEGLTLEEIEFKPQTSKFDLSVTFKESDNGIEIHTTYNSDVYLEERIRLMLEHFATLAESALSNSSNSIYNLKYLSNQEESVLFDEFNNTKVPLPKMNVVTLFERRVQETPDGAALVFEENTLTYRALNERSNQVARHLLKNYHIVQDDLVAVSISRGLEMIIALLGVLKSGAAYLPIDIEYPEERKDIMLSDSNVKVLITDLKNSTIISPQRTYLIGDELNEIKTNPNIPISPDSLVYAIYTSGSTGRPKGVLLEHSATYNLSTWLGREIYEGYGKQSVTMLFASIAFDSSVKQIFPPLLWGGKLVIISEENRKIPDVIAQEMIRNNVGIIDFTPSYLQYFLTSSSIAGVSLDYTLLGGEPLESSLTKAFFTKLTSPGKLMNLYGVTEAGVDSTFSIYSQKDLGPYNIGKPIVNTSVYVLNSDEQSLPIGIQGQIAVAGNGVARGYLNDPELTHKKFITHRENKGEKVYLSGDFGKWSENGTLEFVGRADDQIKLNGYRIELEEIRKTILGHQDINSAFVQMRKQKKDVKLVAFYVAATNLQLDDIRKYLDERLPAYMIPALFIPVDKIPMRVNGKVDIEKLPDPSAHFLRKQSKLANQEVNPMNHAMMTVWSEVLGIELQGVHDNFFEIGGNSLKVIELFNKLNTQYPGIIQVYEIFGNPTIHQLSKVIRNRLETQPKEKIEMEVNIIDI